ncbi:hypothetical protein HPB48_019676 [Haemaphysalis longicornis]|uniref:TRPM SLOG domain-containing protein n=1 Tax=Haemaphysalis longicornis TaxID=44386 RepID=A0A9J6G2K5_HAELO|nr:hypothetical protein HPB48_019676 [Haemaphysalis longicornis]
MAAVKSASCSSHIPKELIAEKTHQSATINETESRYLRGKGTIHFWKNFAFEEEGRPYIRVTHDISIEDVLAIFVRDWKLTLPRIVLVIISSLTTWQEWSAPRQLDNFKEGLIKAANTTAMWILTNGVNTGIVKEIGSRVSEESVQRLTMRCHRHPHTDFEKRPPLCLLGIVREDLLTCADKFEANKGDDINIENSGNRPEENRFDLNPDHTHFVIVKDNTVNKTGLNDFMLRLEKHLSMTYEDVAVSPHVAPTLCSAEIPLMAIVCQGAIGSNKRVLEHIKRQLPVLVLQGSGGAADLLALAYNEIDRRGATLWDPEFTENVLKPELSSQICRMFPKFRDNALSRNSFKDKIVECLRLACQVTQVRNHQAHQIKKDLLLTLDWNCPQVAMTKVFSKDFAEKYKIDREDFEYALLKPKREEFLHIFLNRGFQIHKYLTPKRLRQLFTKIQHEDFFRSVCWEGALGHTALSKIGKKFIEVDLNWLIETMTGLRDFVDKDELLMNTVMGMYVQDAAAAERKALVILSLWAALTNRRKTAEVLWKNSDQPVHLALLISMTYEKLTTYVTEGTTKQELLVTSRQFAAMATGVFNLCYLDSTCRAYDILSVHSMDWKYKTAVDIAAEARNRTFLAHPCCQKWLTNHFFGRISVREITWGFFSVPLGLKVALCAFTVLPMYIWVRFKSDPDRMEYGDDQQEHADGLEMHRGPRDYIFRRHVHAVEAPSRLAIRESLQRQSGRLFGTTILLLPPGAGLPAHIPQLGPLLYKIRLMVLRDFANFMRLALLVIISGGIVMHAILYPDYPLTAEIFRRIFHKAWFSLYLTPNEDLEDSDTSCPNPGLWPYVFAVLYFVHLKLILLTVLFALFRLTLMLEDVDYQRTLLNQLRGQVQEVQRRMHLSLAYLESLKQVSSRTDPTSLTAPQQQTMLHYISRQSPYPGTKIRRCPVPNKYVPWEVIWQDYDPVVYTRPRSKFPGTLQVYVDEDILT